MPHRKQQLTALACCALMQLAVHHCFAESLPEIVPVKWERFQYDKLRNDDAIQCGKMLLNAAKYNFAWAVQAANHIEQNGETISGREAHDIIRPACSAAHALSIVLKTGLFDEQAAGVSRKDAVKRTVRLIKVTVAVHHNRGWKYQWQSAFWAANLAHASWLLWDELDDATRNHIRTMLVNEANRFLDYKVPYWNGQGGDTKAEENSWNSSIILVAVAMMPDHPNVSKWKQKGSELMLSAFAYQTDATQNETVIDGKPVKTWLRGFNVRSDGAVINHGLVHCDYMCCVNFQLHGFSTLSLAGQPVSQAVDFNASRVYRTLVMQQWPASVYKKPGGTMYIPGKAEVYYPLGTDWSNYRFDIFYLLDVYSHLCQLDSDLPHKASSWMRIRAKKILEMQSRHPDRRMFADGEFDTFPGREQQTARQLADAYLLFWLHEQKALLPQSNWLE